MEENSGQMIKVAMIARASLFKVRGGDTVQVESTAEYLRKLGLEVGIYLTDQEINYNEYDLLHFFNIIRPADILRHVERSSKPFVISTIYLDYTDGDRYGRKGVLGFLQRILDPFQIEYVKALGRMLVNREYIGSWRYLIRGHRHSVRYLMKRANMLLPNSQSERDRLFNDVGSAVDNVMVVPNGIDPSHFKRNTQPGDAHKVICVARFENNKNQLNVIRALNDTEFDLTFIGRPAPNQKSYYQRCRDLASSNVHFVEEYISDREAFADYFKDRKVHILASWAETTGLSSLEAAVLGCNVVITNKGDTYEYFREDAFYCEPDDPNSILEAVRRASKAPLNEEFQDRILSNYTWEKTAEVTQNAYKKVLHLSL
jgi:glycosyltransferase involved in cell wall biosynthesis